MAAVNESRPRLPWLWLGLAIVVSGSIAIGITAVPILAGVLFPPTIPPPSSAVLRTHTNPAYGVDEWTYTLTGDTCSAYRHYEGQGGACTITSGQAQCADAAADDRSEPVFDFTCSGTIRFSIFRMVWRAQVMGTDLVVHRAVDWTGGGQRPTSASDQTEG
jgi:hypothetical protein